MDLEKRQTELEELYNDLDQRKLVGIILELTIENIELKKQLKLCEVSSSAFKDEIIRKTESMIWFARENYNKEYYEGVLNAMRNIQVHIKKIHKKHYC